MVNQSLLGLRQAEGGLRWVWCPRRNRSLGKGQDSLDPSLCLVSGPLGQADELEGSGEAFQTAWDHVFRSLQMAVNWERNSIDLSGVSYRHSPGSGSPREIWPQSGRW